MFCWRSAGLTFCTSRAKSTFHASLCPAAFHVGKLEYVRRELGKLPWCTNERPPYLGVSVTENPLDNLSFEYIGVSFTERWRDKSPDYDLTSTYTQKTFSNSLKGVASKQVSGSFTLRPLFHPLLQIFRSFFQLHSTFTCMHTYMQERIQTFAAFARANVTFYGRKLSSVNSGLHNICNVYFFI